jgi:uncharacterized protein
MLDKLTDPQVFQLAGLGIVAVAALAALSSLLSLLRSVGAAGSQERRNQEAFQLRIEEARVALKTRERKAKLSWEGQRKFVVKRKFLENKSKDICSFYLFPHDGRPLPEFNPGQFLTFRLNVPDKKKPVVRCYSLSDGPREDYYRVSIKHLKAHKDRSGADKPAGVSSSFFHLNVHEGDILDVKAPNGKFYLDMTRDWPACLIGGGVGVTPVLSMLEAVVARQPLRKAYFYYGVRNSDELAQWNRIKELGQQGPNAQVWFCISNPTPEDSALIQKSMQERAAAAQRGETLSINYHEGRISVPWILEMLPEGATQTHHFYTCGPGPMMNAIVEQCEKAGVPDSNNHSEAFGPASVAKKPAAPVAAGGPTIDVTFSKSGKVLTWDPNAGNFLEFAESHDLEIDSGCRAGDCHTCKVAVKSGDVKYIKEPPEKPEAGTCLTCISYPAGNVTLDV